MATLEQTWRWFGPNDPVSLAYIRQTGATGIVSALHHVPNGDIWSIEEIQKRKNQIESAGLSWSVVESIPVHESIKQGLPERDVFIAHYQASIRNLAACGIDTVCYNFMPLLDWTRTDLAFPLPDGSTGLRFDAVQACAFERGMLGKSGESFSEEVHREAELWLAKATEEEKNQLIKTIIAGLPGSEESFTLTEFKKLLQQYDSISAEKLTHHLHYFVEKITPVAEEVGIRLAIHPDDPPFPIFGLPRVVSTEKDAKNLLDAVPSLANGLCFCTGSYGVRPDNDLVGMVQRLGHRIHFVHLRATRREPDGSFFEADHLDGDVDMPGVMQALISEQERRIQEGRSDIRLPYRPDHGHCMLDDLEKKEKTNPGYTAIGRLRGLAELRGLERGLRRKL